MSKTVAVAAASWMAALAVAIALGLLGGIMVTQDVAVYKMNLLGSN